jgi:hypothetical protein
MLGLQFMNPERFLMEDSGESFNRPDPFDQIDLEDMHPVIKEINIAALAQVHYRRAPYIY